MLKRLLAIVFMVTGTLGVAQNSLGPGNAISLDGSNDYVDVGPAISNMTLPVTVTAWVRQNPTSSTNVIFSTNSGGSSNYHGVWLRMENSTIVAAMGGGSGGFSAAGRSTYSVNTSGNITQEWFHIAVVYRAMGDMDVYINGILQNGTYLGSATTWSNTHNGSFWIGRIFNGSPRHFDGEIDNFAFYERELTANEIQERMCRKIDPTYPDLLVGFDFNEAASANTFTNLGSHSQNGVRTGPISVASPAPIGDESDFQYAATGSGYFTGQTVNIPLGGEVFEVSNLINPAQGVHVYRILNDPSINVTNCTSPDAWGVFVAEDDFGTTSQWDVSMGANQITHSRDNITNTWQPNPGPLSGLSFQVELTIQGQAAVQLFPPDTTVCPGETVPISLPNSGTYVWDDGNTSASRVLSPGTYIVTGNFGGCTAEDTLIISEFSINSLPFTDTTTCDSVLFIAPPGVTVMWVDGSVGNRYLFPGTYAVSLTSGNCSFVETIVVGTSTPEDIPYFPTYTFCEGESLNFSIPSSFSIVNWSDGYVGNQRTISEPGAYEFTASSSCGDVDGSFQVFVENCDNVYIYLPNAFTPDGDGLNDVYYIENLAGLEFTWTVFDRWGTMIYQTSDPDGYWDGTFRGRLVSEGAYPIILKYKTRSGEFAEKTAFITVLR